MEVQPGVFGLTKNIQKRCHRTFRGLKVYAWTPLKGFLPRCMECRRGLAMRILSVRLSVRLSVSLSVTRVHCDKTVGRSVQIYTPYERTFSLVF